MKTLFNLLIIFLFLGLYIDVNTDSKSRDSLTRCNGDYLQRMVVVQTIVPFRPERESFYFGIGRKHFDRHIEIDPPYCDSREKKWESVRVSEQGCYQGKSNPSPYGKAPHIIDLAWFVQPVEEPIKYTAWYEEVTEEQFKKAERVWGNMTGQVCDPELGGRGARFLEQL